MKWIFLAGLFLLTPLLIVYLKSNRQHLPLFAFALGLLPFIESRFNVSASPIAWPEWPGIAKGIELSLTDSVAIAMLLAGSRVRTPMALKISIGILVAAYFISMAKADAWMPSFFYGWNFLRTVLVFYAVARASVADRRVPAALLTGLITGLAVQAVVVSYEYARGARQAGGWFGHQNMLGMASHFIVYPALAAFLGGYYRNRALVAVVAGLIVAFAGGSRATVGLLVVGMIVTMILSYRHSASGRKASIAAAALIGVIAVSPLLYSAIERRSAESIASSNEQRRAMIAAATMIIVDHPQGVGANRYVIVSNIGGYSARANVAWNERNRAAPVHNTYYLVTAEMGWLGLIGLLAMLGTLIATALSTLRRAPQSFVGEYAAGIAACFLMIAAHSWVEWITMSFLIHIMLAMTVGVLVAIRASIPDARRTVLGTAQASAARARSGTKAAHAEAVDARYL